MSTQTPRPIDDVLTEARMTVNDNTVPFRWSNTTLLSYLNTALRELYRYRPDAYIGAATPGAMANNASPFTTFQASDLGLTPATALPVDDRLFFSALVFYVAGRAELSDDEFADDNRAMTLLTAFKVMLVGEGA